MWREDDRKLQIYRVKITSTRRIKEEQGIVAVTPEYEHECCGIWNIICASNLGEGEGCINE
jgi:hypothetical protein